MKESLMNMKMLFTTASLVGLGLSSCVISGCSHSNGNKQPFISPKDSWYKAPPASTVAKIREKDYLQESEFCIVDSVMQATAINLLRSTSSVCLNKAKAALFCSRNDNKRTIEKASSKGTTPYLVRGLFLNESTGAYSVIRLPNALWIDHGSLGKNPVKMKRQALIVFIKQQPKQVFVTCSMAE